MSVPCMCEMSKLSMRFGSSSKIERVLHPFRDGFGAGLQHAETLIKGMLGVVGDQIEKGALAIRVAA